MERQGNIAELVAAAITERTEDRSTLLRLSAASWPGRDDRTVPVGREWVRAWGPKPVSLALPHISPN